MDKNIEEPPSVRNWRNLLSRITPGISVSMHIYLWKETLRKRQVEIVEKPYQIAVPNKNFNGIGSHPLREDICDDGERDTTLWEACGKPPMLDINEIE